MDSGTIMSAVSLAANVAMAVFLAVLNRRTAKIDQLEQQLAEAVTRRVDERWEAHRRECQIKHETLARDVELVHERLGRGDAAFEALDEAGRENALKLVMVRGDLREWMLSSFVSKGEFVELAKETKQVSAQLARVLALLQQQRSN